MVMFAHTNGVKKFLYTGFGIDLSDFTWALLEPTTQFQIGSEVEAGSF
jgi:hypothetical protein